MRQQGTPFSWYFTHPELRDISIFYSNVDRVYRLCRRTQLSERHFQVSPLSKHSTLEDATQAAKFLNGRAT